MGSLAGSGHPDPFGPAHPAPAAPPFAPAPLAPPVDSLQTGAIRVPAPPSPRPATSPTAFIFALFLSWVCFGLLTELVVAGDVPDGVGEAIKRLTLIVFLGCSFAMAYGIFRREPWTGRAAVGWAGSAILAEAVWIFAGSGLGVIGSLAISLFVAVVPVMISAMVCAWVYGAPAPEAADR